MKYKVTLYLEANTHPRKWLPDTVWEALDSGEDILDYRIEQYEENDMDYMDSSDMEMLQEQLRKFSPPQEYDDE
tara:strand:+ start:75 stop:296 length:222 start_codon:yes stop_codon:yes gene_type:complete